MDLWAAVKEFIGDYYSECSSTGVEKGLSPNLLQKIIDRASRDCGFRRKLFSSPVETFAGEGFVLPPGFKVELVEEDSDSICLPLPPYVGEVEGAGAGTGKKLQAVVQRAVTDREFRNRLVRDPREVLAGEGFTVPPEKRVRVLECTDDTFYAVLPLAPGAEVCGRETLELRVEGDIAFIKGQLDSAGAARIRDTLLAWDRDLTLDLGGTSYISSAGLALLLATRKRLGGLGKKMSLRHIRPEVRNVFILAGLAGVFGL